MIRTLVRGRCHVKQPRAANPKTGVFLLGERETKLIHHPATLILRKARFITPQEYPRIARLYLDDEGIIRLEIFEPPNHPLIRRAIALLQDHGISVRVGVRAPMTSPWAC